MDQDYLRNYWKRLSLVKDDGEHLNLVDIFSACLGEHKEGLLFKGTGKYAEKSLIVRLDENSILYRRFADIEQKDVDWVRMGFLSDRKGFFIE